MKEDPLLGTGSLLDLKVMLLMESLFCSHVLLVPDLQPFAEVSLVVS